jgi:chromosome partitioning protein
MQSHFLAMQGLSKLLETVRLVNQGINAGLVVSGIILCMHDPQTVLATEVMNDLRLFLESARGMDVPWREAVILQPPIRRNIKLAECPGFGKTIFDYAAESAGSQDYKALAGSVMKQASVRT